MTKDALDARVLAAVEAGHDRASVIDMAVGDACQKDGALRPDYRAIGESLQRLKRAGKIEVRSIYWTASGAVTLTVQLPRECEQNLRVWLAHNAGKVL